MALAANKDTSPIGPMLIKTNTYTLSIFCYNQSHIPKVMLYRRDINWISNNSFAVLTRYRKVAVAMKSEVITLIG